MDVGPSPTSYLRLVWVSMAYGEGAECEEERGDWDTVNSKGGGRWAGMSHWR